MADLITRCPKCSTAFRITEDLIKSAKGVVRCGSCLNVFNATEYIVKKPNKPEDNSQSVSMSKVISDLEDMAKATQTIHQSAASHAVAANSPGTKLKKPQVISSDSKLNRPAGENPALFERKSDDADATEDDDENNVDEAWALELLKEDEESDSPQPQLRKIVEPERSSNQVDTEVEPPQEQSSPEQSSATLETRPSEQPTARPNRPEPSPQNEPHHAAPTRFDQESRKDEIRTETENTSPYPTEAEDDSRLASESEEAAPLAKSESSPQKDAPAPSQNSDQNSPTEPKIAAEQDTFISGIEIEPEPLDSILEERKKPLFVRILWPTLTFFALAGVIGQIFWIQFYRWNQEQPYRFIYQVACMALECELPELLDRGAIQTSNLVIRSHPETADALLVDVIIKNKAAFEQRFPSIRLTFTDIKNNAIATRSFKASEYLGGELTGMTMMPKDQGIHIGLEIIDPGPKAVSYTIAVEN